MGHEVGLGGALTGSRVKTGCLPFSPKILMFGQLCRNLQVDGVWEEKSLSEINSDKSPKVAPTASCIGEA